MARSEVARSRAHDDLIVAARECAKALHHASHDGIHNKHWWQEVGETLSDIGGKIAEYAGDVSMVIAAISPILDIIAAATIEIPGLDVITGGLALLGTAAAAATTTGTAMKMTGDGMQGHYADMFGDAAAMTMSRVGGKGATPEEELPPAQWRRTAEAAPLEQRTRWFHELPRVATTSAGDRIRST